MTTTEKAPEGQMTRPDNCECDNTHEQNSTCCMPCWDAGFRTVAPSHPDNAKLESARAVIRKAKGEL